MQFFIKLFNTDFGKKYKVKKLKKKRNFYFIFLKFFEQLRNLPNVSEINEKNKKTTKFGQKLNNLANKRFKFVYNALKEYFYEGELIKKRSIQHLINFT